MSGSGRKLGSSNFLNQQRLEGLRGQRGDRARRCGKMSGLYSIERAPAQCAEAKRRASDPVRHILAARMSELPCAKALHMQGRAVEL